MDLPVHVIGAGVVSVIFLRFFGIINLMGLFCFASFLDVDHYIYYILKFRNLHIGKAIKYFESHKHIERFCLCIFHTVEFFILFVLLTYFSRSFFLYACFIGILSHYILDIAQGLYYKRMHYRWWSAISYFRTFAIRNITDDYGN